MYIYIYIFFFFMHTHIHHLDHSQSFYKEKAESPMRERVFLQTLGTRILQTSTLAVHNISVCVHKHTISFVFMSCNYIIFQSCLQGELDGCGDTGGEE